MMSKSLHSMGFRVASLIRYSKFCLVGLSGVFVDMFVLYLLYSPSWVGLGLTASKVAAAEVAMINNFLWNDRWTFSGKGSRNRGLGGVVMRFLKFNAICSVGVLFSVAALQFGVRVLEWNVTAANIFAIILGSVWNYTVNSKFAWTTPAVVGAGNLPVQMQTSKYVLDSGPDGLHHRR